jgi:hypothetical protein
MTKDSTLTQALANVRHQREALEAEFERVSGELSKLRLAERSLASIVEGTPMEDNTDDQPKRRRAAASDDQPRATRGPRGPRANSAKGRLKALLEEAGSQGLSHAQITERLHDVAANTLATYLSVMATSGELVRQGDSYRSGTQVADPGSDDPKSHDQESEEADGSDHDQADDDRAEEAA